MKKNVNPKCADAHELQRKGKLWNKDLWSQQELADYLGVTTNTIKNYRERGLLSYFQAPGSTRKQYFRDEIELFVKDNTVTKIGGNNKTKKRLKKEKTVISPNSQDEDWRI